MPITLYGNHSKGIRPHYGSNEESIVYVEGTGLGSITTSEVSLKTTLINGSTQNLSWTVREVISNSGNLEVIAHSPTTYNSGPSTIEVTIATDIETVSQKYTYYQKPRPLPPT